MLSVLLPKIFSMLPCVRSDARFYDIYMYFYNKSILKYVQMVNSGRFTIFHVEGHSSMYVPYTLIKVTMNQCKWMIMTPQGFLSDGAAVFLIARSNCCLIS